MEAFQVPVSALISICIGLTVLAMAVADTQLWSGHPIEKNLRNPSYTTQCERLMTRYINDKNSSYEDLINKVERFFGNESKQMLLAAFDTIFNNTNPNKLDRLFYLKGLILKDLKREEEATEALRKALILNPDNAEARMELLIHHLKGEMFGLGQMEKEETPGIFTGSGFIPYPAAGL